MLFLFLLLLSNDLYRDYEVFYSKDGLIHRVGAPAVIHKTTGDKFWWNNGKIHRDDGPAIEAHISKQWWINGKRHRENGPAIEWANGSKEWWVDGRFIKKEIQIKNSKDLK